MKKIFVFLLTLICSFSLSFAQIFQGKDADKIIKGAQTVRISTNDVLPSFIKFYDGNEPLFINLKTWFAETFKTEEGLSFIQTSNETDQFGFTHYRFQQTINGIPIREAQFIVHVKNEKIVSFNGKIFNEIELSNSDIINKDLARSNALDYVNAISYKWQNPLEEKWIKANTGNKDASFYPVGEKEIIYSNKTFYLAYKFDIYASSPLSRQDIYVDAANGKILKTLNKLFSTDKQGTAVTKYSGTQTMTVDSVNATLYRLKETGRGNGINTYNMLQQTDYNSAVDFTDSDNYWNNVNTNQDEIAADAHWGAEMTYDYFFIKHGRNSIDGNGFALNSYVHYDQAYPNAFWDGYVMTYGDGSGSYTPFTALDICAHEITHGLDSYTANLDYAGESGAMNEGFSDIFGTAVEFFAKPSMANWTCGENIGTVIRNLGNPNATQNPDTYLGTYWDNQQEVHQNSTVLSYWFYLVSQGGSGTNDIGNAFNVTGIGINKAATIAYRMLTYYLINTSDFTEARFYAIQAATDIYGGCTPEVETVTNAMYAVGIGGQYIASVVADFSSDMHVSCSAPFSVKFKNLSSNATTYLWDFGDGSTSILANPTHIYTAAGNYDVNLTGTSTGCGSDALLQTDYISIDGNNTNIASIPLTSTSQPLTCCTGTLYDSGGNSDYSNNSDGSITIAPTGASSVQLTFSTFNFESGFDYLYIYNGPTTASPLIGKYDGSALPGGGIINSTNGAITLRQFSDQGVTSSGFKLTWQCSLPNVPPVASFSVSATNSCTGVIDFQDLSINGPSSWLWDFGDGGTSTLQNPTHAYSADGVYTVTLQVTNIIGSNNITKTDYIIISMPASPTVTPASGCDSNSVTISASGIGQLDWYDAQIGGNLLFSGTSYTTPVLYNSTTYYVEDKIIQPSVYGGKTTNSGAGGNYNSSTNFHYEIFNCYQPLMLASVKVYATGAGSRTIQLRDSAMTVLKTLTVNIPDGESRVSLNFDLPVQNKLQLICSTTANLFRNNSNSASYPYTIPGKLSITESSASLPPYNSSGNYYFFYDWEVTEPVCTSPRIPVLVTITPCSSINDLSDISEFSVYPNPASNYVNVEFTKPSATLYTITILDLIGKEIMSHSFIPGAQGTKFILNTSMLSKGSYLLKITDVNSMVKVQKLVIQ